MEKQRKLLGIGFIILFFAQILSHCTGYLLDFLYDKVSFEEYHKAHSGWLIFIQFVNILSTIFITFICIGQSSISSKIGGVVFALLNLFYLTNNLSLIFTGENLLSPMYEKFNHIGRVLWFTLYLPGLTLLVWGSKLWKPSKITFSVYLLLVAIMEILFMLPGHISYAKYDLIYLIYKITNPIEILGLLACVILTIVWVCKKPKDQINNLSFKTIAY